MSNLNIYPAAWSRKSKDFHFPYFRIHCTFETLVFKLYLESEEDADYNYGHGISCRESRHFPPASMDARKRRGPEAWVSVNGFGRTGQPLQCSLRYPLDAQHLPLKVQVGLLLASQTLGPCISVLQDDGTH